MSRRSTPERIAAAHEAGIRNWLRDDRRVLDVDALMAAWAREAEARCFTRRDSAYWSHARRWLEERSG